MIRGAGFGGHQVTSYRDADGSASSIFKSGPASKSGSARPDSGPRGHKDRSGRKRRLTGACKTLYKNSHTRRTAPRALRSAFSSGKIIPWSQPCSTAQARSSPDA